MTVYVFNTLVTPVNFDEVSEAKISLRRINIEEAKQIAKQIMSKGFISAIGHEGTAQLLSKLLGIQIPTNRITVFMKPGDCGIHFFLKQRLPEGTVLNEEQLKRIPYWLVLSEVE